MRLTLKKRTAVKLKTKMKNKARIRKKVSGTAERPRLAVFKSGKHTYAQIINDVTGSTMASASTLDKSFTDKKSNKDAAKTIGESLAKKAQALKVTSVVFDRSGYVYHGRIKSIADGAREAGLKF